MLQELYKTNPGPFVAMFSDLFDKVMAVEREDRHIGYRLLYAISETHAKVSKKRVPELVDFCCS